LQMYGVSAESGLSGKKSDLKGTVNFLLGESKPVARSTSEYAYEKLLNSGEVTDGQVQMMNAVRNIAGTAPEVVLGLISGGAGNAAMIAGDAGRIYDSLIREGYEPYDAAKVATVLTANDAIWRKGLSTLPGITDGRSVITKALPSGNALTRTIGLGASGFAEGSGRELTEQMIINSMTGEPDDIDWGRVFESGFDEGVENAVFSVPRELAGVYGALENKYKAGYNEGEGISFDIEKIRPKLKTEPNVAFFWSGKTDGIGGVNVAADIAKIRGGVTLELVIDEQDIEMPKWDISDPTSIYAWDMASAAYAEQVSGEVRAVVGDNLREGNIWENIELPALMANENVTKIIMIDPKTGKETVVFTR